MKGIFSLFIFFTSISSARAMTAESTTIDCDYVAASTIISYYEPKVQSSQKKGQLTLVQDGSLYKGEVNFAVFKMQVEGQIIGNDLSLSVNILDIKYATSQKVVALATSLHRSNEEGTFQGTVILRSPEVASIAMKMDVSYETAPLEKLSNGNNFLGAYLSCH
jgi:hypothetical protein